MAAPLDYARYGRQIALPQVGAHGQTRLGEVPVDFTGHESERALAARLHSGAGGRIGTGAVTVTVANQATSMNARTRPEALGLAAVAAVEAARRVLGEAHREFPAALLERLTPPTGSNAES